MSLRWPGLDELEKICLERAAGDTFGTSCGGCLALFYFYVFLAI